MLDVEDWAKIRLLRRSEGHPQQTPALVDISKAKEQTADLGEAEPAKQGSWYLSAVGLDRW